MTPYEVLTLCEALENIEFDAIVNVYSLHGVEHEYEVEEIIGVDRLFELTENARRSAGCVLNANTCTVCAWYTSDAKTPVCGVTGRDCRFVGKAVKAA